MPFSKRFPTAYGYDSLACGGGLHCAVSVFVFRARAGSGLYRDELPAISNDMAGSNQVVYTPRVRIERKPGLMRLAYLPAEKELRQLFCRMRHGLDGWRPQEISP